MAHGRDSHCGHHLRYEYLLYSCLFSGEQQMWVFWDKQTTNVGRGFMWVVCAFFEKSALFHRRNHRIHRIRGAFQNKGGRTSCCSAPKRMDTISVSTGITIIISIIITILLVTLIIVIVIVVAVVVVIVIIIIIINGY